MPSFGQKSLEKLSTLDPRLERLLAAAIEVSDFTILCGHRGQVEQNQAFESGNSRLPWPHSKHNSKPSVAVDVAPWPIDWQATDRFCFLAGILFGLAKDQGINIRWGADFAQDGLENKDNFMDYPHIELVD